MKKSIAISLLFFLVVCCPLISNAQSKKPLVWVKSANDRVIFLYQLCNNSLVIEGLNSKGEKLNNPTFKARNAQILKAEKSGWLELYPEKGSKEVVVLVSENEILIDSLIIPVKKTPLPELNTLYNNKPVDYKQGIELNGYSTGNLKIEIVPDADFKSFLPKDARYILSDAKITLARGKNVVASQTIDYLGNANIFDLMAQAKPGDRLMVEVPRVIRIDSQDNVEKFENGFYSVFTIPLN